MTFKMKFLVNALLLFFGTAVGFAQVLDGLTISKLTYDKTANLWVIDLGLENNGKVYQEFQCDFALPKGLTYKGNRSNKDRISVEEDPESGYLLPTHRLLQNVLDNGTMRVLVVTDTARPFLGQSGRLYTIRFVDDGTLDKNKAYDVNLTNIEIVYRTSEDKLFGYRQQGIINDPSLRCFDALCNATSVYGEISQKDLDWMNRASLHNDNQTSVDLTHCTNASVGTLLLKNHNVMIYTSKENQVDGNQNVVLNGVCSHLKLTDKMPFSPLKDFIANEVTYKMTIGEANYATVVLPFSCDIPTGLEAYRLTSVDDVDNAVKGELLHALEAHQPVLLKGNASNYVFHGMKQTITRTPEVMKGGLLIGSYLPIVVEPDNYLLQRQADGVAFYKVGANSTPGMKPFRAYLQGAQFNGQWLSISLDDPTGIEALFDGDKSVNDIYNVNGQKLNRQERGVNIIRNKYGLVRKCLVK